MAQLLWPAELSLQNYQFFGYPLSFDFQQIRKGKKQVAKLCVSVSSQHQDRRWGRPLRGSCSKNQSAEPRVNSGVCRFTTEFRLGKVAITTHENCAHHVLLNSTDRNLPDFASDCRDEHGNEMGHWGQSVLEGDKFVMFYLLVKLQTLLFALLAAFGRSEEHSVMTGCTVSDHQKWVGNTVEPTGSVTCDGGYKTWFQSDVADEQEITMALTKPATIVSVFVSNEVVDFTLKQRFGTEHIWVGSDNSTPFSGAPAMNKRSGPFFDTGFHKLTTPATGEYIAIRKEGDAAVGGYNNIMVHEVRAYQTQNILLELQGTATIVAPDPIAPQWSAQNLISNMGTRSSGNDLPPLIDGVGTPASFHSCYKTDKTKLAPLGHKMELTIDFKQSFFQHAVLFISDLGADWFTPNGPIYLENVRVFVGDSPNYTLNVECAGGPFLVDGDPNSYVNGSWNGYSGSVWKYGQEVWCNLKGRYTTLVSDMNHKAALAYTISLCQLGVMAAIYERPTPAPSTVAVTIGSTLPLKIAKIAALATYPIGNTLNIKLRQKSGVTLSWVTFEEQPTETNLDLAPDRSVVPGVYTLVLESFDQDGGVYSTLKTDTILVTVNSGPPECLVSLTQNAAFETTQSIVLIQEYQPTVYFPQPLFAGPHTYTGYTCGGTYSQSITIDAPVPGVVITDQPTGADLRPRLAIGSTASAGSTFTLTFTGHYVHVPSATDLTVTFMQTYTLKSVFAPTYLDQPTISHSLTAAQLTFTVPPAASGATPPTQTLAGSLFGVAYPIKAGTTDPLGNTPPAIAPVPYAGFSSTAIAKGQPSLGTTTLTSPCGILTAVGFSGDLDASSSLRFACDPWSLSNKGTSEPKILNFANSVEAAFKASLQVTCTYELSIPPMFASALATQTITTGVAKMWTLPPVTNGSFAPTTVRFETAAEVASFITFDATSRTVSYNGSHFGTYFSSSTVTIVLIDSAAQENPFTQALTILLPPECSQALTQNAAFETTQSIVLIQEYQPTVYFPQPLFAGPHTYTGYTCGGTYSQSITIDAPVPGVVITDQPTGADLRPRLAIGSTASAGSTFTLTFTGHYVHVPSATDLTVTFMQTYTLKSVFAPTYLDQPTISHSLTAAQLTFTVPPAASGATPPTQTLAGSLFGVAYPIKAGTTDPLGNTPPAIAPVPYAGFSSTAIAKGQPSLGTTTLTSPCGILTAVGFSGDLDASSSLRFACDPWTPALRNTLKQLTLQFRNSVEPDFVSFFTVNCSYIAAPEFVSELEAVSLLGGAKKQWALPQIYEGLAKLIEVRFKPDVAINAYLNFDSGSITVTFNGDASIFQLQNQALKITFTLVNSFGLKSSYAQIISVSVCPITGEQADALSIVLARKSLTLTLQAGEVGFLTASYKSLLTEIVDSLAFDKLMQQQCGPISTLLVSKKPFLYQEPSAQLLVLLADKNTEEGAYEDAYFNVSIFDYNWRIPVRVEFTGCILTSLSFEERFVTVTYAVGSGILKADLPNIVQKPDCGLDFEAVKIMHIEAAKPDEVVRALKLDKSARALLIETSDPSLSNTQASLTFGIDSRGRTRVENLIIDITFKPNSTHAATANSDFLSSTASALTTTGVDLKKLSKELGIAALEFPPLSKAQTALLEVAIDKIAKEQLFLSVPLAARLSKGVEYLNQFVLEQRKQFTWQRDLPKASQPPDVLFVALSNAGVLEMRFTSQMQFPSNATQTIQTNGGPVLRRLQVNRTAEPRIELYGVRSQDPNNTAVVDLGPLIRSWNLDFIGERGLSISLNFSEPLLVSMMDDQPDILFIQLELSQFFDNRGKSLPESLVKHIAIPRQIATQAEASVIYAAASAAVSTAAGVISVSFLINILVAGSLFKVWSLINSLQVVQTVRLFNVKSPGNVNAFIDFFNDITSLAFLETEVQQTTEKVVSLPEKDAMSLNFQNAGFNTSYFIPNAQVLICLIMGHVGLAVPYLLLWLFERCCSCARGLRRKLGVYIFWNGSLRLMMETYFDAMLFSMVNLYALDSEDNQKSVQINNWTIFLVGAIYLLGSAILLIYVCKNVRRHESADADFIARYGAFLEGTRRKREYRCAVLLVPTSFLLKRLLLSVSLVFMQNFFWGQVATQLFFTTYMIILHQGGRPMVSTFDRNMETFNEVVTLLVLYLLMYFSDFNNDVKLRDDLGYVFIVVVSTFAAVHLFSILSDIFRNTKLICKRYYNRCCRKQQRYVRKVPLQAPQTSQAQLAANFPSSSVSEPSVEPPKSSVESLPRKSRRSPREAEQKCVNIPLKVKNSHMLRSQKKVVNPKTDGKAFPNLSDISDVEDAPVPASISVSRPMTVDNLIEQPKLNPSAIVASIWPTYEQQLQELKMAEEENRKLKEMHRNL